MQRPSEKTYAITLAQIKVLANMASAIDYAKSHAHIAALAGMPEFKSADEIQRDIKNFVGVQHRILEKLLGEDAEQVYSLCDSAIPPATAEEIFTAVSSAAQVAA